MSAHLDRARRLGAAVILALALLGVTAAFVVDPQAAGAAPMSSAGFVTSGSATPSSVAAGSAVSVKVDVKSDRARSAVVDVEIYDSAGRKAAQQFWDNQSFAAGATRSYTVAWTPATGSQTGTYAVKVGIFSVSWGTLIHWNNQATTVQV